MGLLADGLQGVARRPSATFPPAATRLLDYSAKENRMDPKDKVAIVTGAGSGIGRATAVALAVAGASVVVADVNEDGGRETVLQVEGAGGTASFKRVDVRD